MNFEPLRHDEPPLPIFWLLLLVGLYLFSATLAHDPWKSQDAIHIGIAYDFSRSDNWLLPYLAGQPWPHTAPLYHWVATACAKLFDGILSFHNGARLATPLFASLFLIALSGAARTLNGRDAGRITPLLVIGTLGLLSHLHDAQPAVAALAFAALAWWGGARVLMAKRHGALMLGIGAGLTFPAYGLPGLLMVIAILPAPLLRRDWFGQLLVLFICGVLLLAWPLAVQLTAPELWPQWLQWWHNQLELLSSARAPERRHLELILWATWPILPLAIWTLRLQSRNLSPLLLPLLASLIALAWYLSKLPRTLNLLPLLIPLTLLAAAGTLRLRRSSANAFDWFGLMTFSFIALLIWLGASAQLLDWPPQIARNFEKLAPGHEADISFVTLSYALVLTLAWLFTWYLPRATWRPSFRWAAGVTLMWTLLAALWLPWIEHYKSFRPLVVALQQALPQNVNCIERQGIDASHQALLDYFGAIRTTTARQSCDWRLSIGAVDRIAPAGWATFWRGGRPSDRKEQWYLDQRER